MKQQFESARQAYLYKAQQDNKAIDALNVRRAGTVFADIVFVRGMLHDEELRDGVFFEGADRDALVRAACALGYAENAWQAVCLTQDNENFVHGGDLEFLLCALDAQAYVLVDTQALDLCMEAYAEELGEHAQGLASGKKVNLRGMKWVYTGDFAQALHAQSTKQRAWQVLKQLSQMP